MIPELKTALLAAKGKSGSVVDCMPNTICNLINRVCVEKQPAAGRGPRLRHSFASLAYHLGMPEKLAMKIGGWSDKRNHE